MLHFSAIQAKLAAAENAPGEGHAEFSQQIQKLQEENLSLRDEKERLARKMERVEKEVKQG